MADQDVTLEIPNASPSRDTPGGGGSRGEAGGWRKIDGIFPTDRLLLLSAVGWPPAAMRGEPWPVKVGGWWDERWHVFGASWEPTHWRELPEPPEWSPWREMATAPMDGTVIEIMAEGYDRPFLIRGELGFVDGSGADCWSWVAVEEGKHPPCWSGGAYWDSNENEMPSTPPLRWRHSALSHPSAGDRT